MCAFFQVDRGQEKAATQPDTSCARPSTVVAPAAEQSRIQQRAQRLSSCGRAGVVVPAPRFEMERPDQEALIEAASEPPAPADDGDDPVDCAPSVGTRRRRGASPAAAPERCGRPDVFRQRASAAPCASAECRCGGQGQSFLCCKGGRPPPTCPCPISDGLVPCAMNLLFKFPYGKV